ncbi:MAG: hypothetical protein ACU0CI_10865 [Shimia sp.]
MSFRWTSDVAASALSIGLTGMVAAQDAAAPDTAIDWLRDIAPAEATPRFEDPLNQQPTALSGLPPAISAAPLGAPRPAVGVLPPAATGLPLDLWAGLSPTQAEAALNTLTPTLLPPLAAVRRQLLLADAAPPAGADVGEFYAMRLRALLRVGLAEDAAALAAELSPPPPAALPAALDAALLVGDEDRMCQALTADIAATEDIRARVFCLARAGNWSAAALTLRTATALGELTEADAEVLTQFLDPELAGALPPLPRTADALEFSLRAAIGVPPATSGLPVAFAHRDLTENAGWKTRLDAAERLARTGAIVPERLRVLYLEGQPSASGALWARAGAVQALEAALAAPDPVTVSARLMAGYEAFAAAGLLDWFSQTYAPGLRDVPLAPVAEGVRAELLLRSPLYEAARLAPGLSPALFEVAAGRAPTAPDSRLLEAIAAGFVAAPPRAPQMTLALETLRAIARTQAAHQGDVSGLAEGLLTLRAIGLERTARRAAILLMLDAPRP